MSDENSNGENEDEDPDGVKKGDDVQPSGFLFPAVLAEGGESFLEPKGFSDAGQICLSGFSSFQPKIENENIEKKILIEDGNQSTHVRNEDFPEKKGDHKILKNRLKTNKKSNKHKNKLKRKRSSSEEDHDSKRKQKKKKRKKDKKTKKKQEGKRNIFYDKSKPDTIWLEETSLKLQDAFRFDKRKVNENLQFDTLYRLDIANYLRFGNLKCLGLKRSQDFEWNDQRSKKGKLKQKDMRYRYFDVKKQKHPTDFASNDVEEHLLPKSGNVVEECGEQKEGVQRLQIPLNFDERKEAGIKKDTTGGKKQDEFSQTTEYLNQTLRQNPHDVDSWIQLANLQDKAFLKEEGTFLSATFSKSNEPIGKHKAVTEKKIDILEKALTKNPNITPLVVEYMKHCREILDPLEVQKKWNDFMSKNANNGVLWQEHLMFLQSDLSNFSTTNVITGYNKCFKTLLAVSEGTIRSFKPDNDHASNLMEIFIQYCLFLMDADQTEKLLSSMQAMIEFNCFASKDMDTVPASGQKAFFEAFWDSEVPRFGESGALGWNNWMLQQKGLVETQAPAKNEIISVKICHDNVLEISEEIMEVNLARSEQWLKTERKRQTDHWQPWKQDDNSDVDECEDPDRVALSDDVLPCIFKLRSEEDILNLLLIHLMLLGVPIKKDFINDDINKKLLAMGCIPQVVKPFSNTVEIEVLDPAAPRHLKSEGDGLLELSKDRLCYIEEVFSQATTIYGTYSENFTNVVSQCWFLFEILLLQRRCERDGRSRQKDTIKGTKKFAKSLLKHSANRNCFELWQMFSCFEYDFGNREEAFRIFDMVISMCSGEKNEGVVSQFSGVFRNYASFLMHAAQQDRTNACQVENKVINLLSKLSVEISSSTPTISLEKMNPLRLRRVKESFKETFTNILEERPRTVSEKQVLKDAASASSSLGPKVSDRELEWVLCFAIFMYFANGIESANDIIHDLEVNITLTKSQILKVTNLKLELLMYTFSMQHTNLSNTRKIIWQAVERFPEDPKLNRMLMEIENKGIASLKVRGHYHKVLENPCSVMPWIFAISYEEERLRTMQTAYKLKDVNVMASRQDQITTTLPSTGIVNRLRGLYSKATSSQEARFCCWLWRDFLRFEVANGNMKRAKNIFYSALQNCPWSKELYLDAINAFKDDFEDIIDIMQEKEIRIRLPVEEFDILAEGQEA